MSEKIINTRVINKHDVEANWIKATTFIPKQGELIVYDIDNLYPYERFKIGDGKTLVSNLPFASITDRYGNVPIDRGGTGANNAIDALVNLGIYIGDTEPTDENIRIWINTAEEGTGVIPMLPRIATITLAKSGWSGSASPYYQTVTIPSVTTSTKIDLLPTAQQVVSLQEQDIALMAENDETGTVKIYSFGGKPNVDMTMQVQLTEVAFV